MCFWDLVLNASLTHHQNCVWLFSCNCSSFSFSTLPNVRPCIRTNGLKKKWKLSKCSAVAIDSCPRYEIRGLEKTFVSRNSLLRHLKRWKFMKTQHFVNLHFSSVVGQNFSHLEEKGIEDILSSWNLLRVFSKLFRNVVPLSCGKGFKTLLP